MGKKLLALLLAAMMCLTLCVGCDSEDPPADNARKDPVTDAKDPADDAKDPVPEEKVPVVYWGTWGAEKQEYIEKLMTEFNASQDKYEMHYEYVGSMNDLLAKLQITSEADLPALVNATTEQAGTYMYSDFIVPVSEFASTSDPAVSMLYGNLVSTWGDLDGNMVGYPMGNSMAGIFFNMDLVGQLGVDPYKDITCLEDLYDICKNLVDGKICTYGIGADWSNIYLNYALSIEGVDSVDNDNGKSAAPTKCFYDQPGTKEYVERYFQLWRDLSDNGYCYNLGASWGNEVLPAFASGDLALVTGTIGGYARLANAWNENHDTPCNIAFIPWQAVTSEGRSSGLPASGNGFYITKATNEAAREGAWEFIKYFSQDDNAATWCTITGYLPISDGCYNSSIYKDYISSDTLDFQYLIDQQSSSDIRSYHPLTPINTEFQAAGIEALEKVIADPSYNIDTAISEMAAAINDALDLWHLEHK